MKTRSLLTAGLLCLCSAAAAWGAGISFAVKPQASQQGDRTTIRFAVSGPTDVEVAILDAGGKVVQHLAAGVLGGDNPPPAPLKAGLSQELVWDGKDDAGKPAEGGPFKVRVAAGLKPAFDGFLLYNPAATGAVQAVAVGPKGELYLFHRDPTANAMMGSEKIAIVSREGRHVRAVTPYPADLPADKAKAFDALFTDSGDLVPLVHNWEELSIYPDPLSSRGVSRPGSSTPVVDSRGRVYWPVMGPAIACLQADGSAPSEGFIGPRLLPDVKGLRMSNVWLAAGEPVGIAVSGDRKSLYLTGLHTGDQKTRKSLACVFKVPIDARNAAEPFIGRPDAPAEGPGALADPGALTVAGGLLYVCDPGAGCVAAYKEADGAFVGSIRVPAAQSVGVDPQSGAVYVIVRKDGYTADLVKFNGVVSGKEVVRVALPRRADGVGHYQVSVDASAKPARIWLPTFYNSRELGCFEDLGDALKPMKDPRDLKAPWAEGPRDLSLDRSRGELYVKVNSTWYRFDEPTGAIKDTISPRVKTGLMFGQAGTQLVPSPDGSLITMSWGAGLVRFDHDGKPLNWEGRDTHCIPTGGLMTFSLKYLAVPRADEIYAILPNTYRAGPDAPKPPPGVWFNTVNVLGMDGQTRRTAIWQCTQGACLRSDRHGNIYLAEPVKPLGRSYPEFFDGKLKPPGRGRPEEVGAARFWNSYMYGSVIKFPPSGGAVWFDKDRRISPSAVGPPPQELLAKPVVKMQAHIGYDPAVPVEIQGADWIRFGFAATALAATGSDTCMCEGPGFDVDPFGRVFYPNLGQFRVEVVDAGNNMIGTFGQYGNQDSGGPNALVTKPDIPLAWPLTVAVSDTHAYVADTVSRRVVKVRLDHTATETCPIGGP
ncbi:MAG: hypothetical protein BIFFINMI_02353 [Phycisphaerae bacterium]|nr:hypothetical protein [Phycisphaerae bacterium]